MLLLTKYFPQILFVLFFIIAIGYVVILTTPRLKTSIQEIADLISIPLGVLALISSGAALYYIYEEFKLEFLAT